MHLAERQYWLGPVVGTYLFAPSLPINATIPDLSVWHATPFASYANCCWFMVATISTVGYGGAAVVESGLFHIVCVRLSRFFFVAFLFAFSSDLIALAAVSGAARPDLLQTSPR